MCQAKGGGRCFQREHFQRRRHSSAGGYHPNMRGNWPEWFGIGKRRSREAVTGEPDWGHLASKRFSNRRALLWKEKILHFIKVRLGEKFRMVTKEDSRHICLLKKKFWVWVKDKGRESASDYRGALHTVGTIVGDQCRKENRVSTYLDLKIKTVPHLVLPAENDFHN